MKEVVDYPKIHAPFVRFTNEKGEYVVRDEINPGFEWIYEPGVRAVDKLHGTNICVTVYEGKVAALDNRDTRVYAGAGIPIKGPVSKFLMGTLNAANRGWLENGVQYGELIGPDINSNLHGTDQYLFVPFGKLLDKYHWKSWVQNKYPKNFASLSDWFREIPSLFSKICLKKDVLAEGLVFYHPDGRKAKLRRDMFQWYAEESTKSIPEQCCQK